MSSILVIYENVPESTNIYLIEDPSAEERAKIRLCHHVFINAGGNTPEQEDAANWLSEFLVGRTDLNLMDEPISVKSSEVILTGFLM